MKIQKIDNWIVNFSEYIAVETLRLIKQYGQAKGVEVTDKVIAEFLANYIRFSVLDKLNEDNPLLWSDKERFEYAYGNFSKVKFDIQNAVSDGFHRSMKEWSGQDVDYFCTVRVAPDAENVEPC